jgi:hypothetical protein
MHQKFELAARLKREAKAARVKARRRAKRLAERTVPRMPNKDLTPAGIEQRQKELCRALLAGSSLSRAWQLAYGRTQHHSSVEKLLSSPKVREMLGFYIDKGHRLRGKLHEKVVAGLKEYNDPFGLL